MTMVVERDVQEILWDASKQAPDFLKFVPGFDGRAGIPAATTITPFETGDAVRPYRHLRAYYLKRADGVLAIKGSEIWADDVDVHLRAMADFRIEFPGRGRSLFSALEHFPLNEQKIPLALTVDEVMEDVQSAAAVQRAHIARFGRRAHVPLPLFAVRWPDEIADDHLRRLHNVLSGRGRRIVDRVAADGLGAVIYHYPSVPLRVAHLPELLRGQTELSWLRRLASIADPEVTLNGWLDLVARLLVLGFLPGSIESIGIGHCLEMKNAVIDGGMVDMGSVCRVEEVTDSRQFSETLLAAMADLAKTSRQFLGGNVADVEAEYRNPSLVMVLMLHRLLPDLAARIETLGGADPRIVEFFHSRQAAESLPIELQRLLSDGSVGGGHG